MSQTPQKPAPKTVPGKTTVRLVKNAQLHVELHAVVLADAGSSDPKIVGAETHITSSHSVSAPPAATRIQKGFPDVIAGFKGPAGITATCTIQTVYGPGAGPEMPSGYGRGTTPVDELNGDTSLGFHESCHREDYLRYLQTQPLPAFGGRVGMTVPQYKDALAAFDQAVTKFFADVEADSYRRTDEVGYKKSEYKAGVPRQRPIEVIVDKPSDVVVPRPPVALPTPTAPAGRR